MVVPQENEKMRVCVDYWELNAQTIMPFTNLMLDQVVGHQTYSFMDGYNGYNQLVHDSTRRQGENHVHYTEWGELMYLVMPFGLCNALASVQGCMMVIFVDFLHVFLAIFLWMISQYRA